MPQDLVSEFQMEASFSNGRDGVSKFWSANLGVEGKARIPLSILFWISQGSNGQNWRLVIYILMCLLVNCVIFCVKPTAHSTYLLMAQFSKLTSSTELMTLNIYSQDDKEYSAHISYVWKALYAFERKLTPWTTQTTLNLISMLSIKDASYFFYKHSAPWWGHMTLSISYGKALAHVCYVLRDCYTIIE